MLTKADKKKIQGLRIKKIRDKYKQYVAEGVKVVEEAIDNEIDIVSIIVKGSLSDREDVVEVISKAQKESIPVEIVKDKEFDTLSALVTPPGIMAVIHTQDNPYVEAGEKYLILDAIKDPGNLGSMIRTADWYGINNIVVGRDSVDVHNPKVIQATMGSLFRVNVVQDEDLFAFLRTLSTQNYSIIATSLHGKEGDLETPTDKVAILVGNESKGVNKELLEFATQKYKISGTGRAESLNVSVATGIVLHELYKK